MLMAKDLAAIDPQSSAKQADARRSIPGPRWALHLSRLSERFHVRDEGSKLSRNAHYGSTGLWN